VQKGVAYYAFRIVFFSENPNGIPSHSPGLRQLPWEMRNISVNPKGVESLKVENDQQLNRRNPLGVVSLSFNDPRVVQPLAGQPWAKGRCPVRA
jgi:hypothetical protein